MKNLIIRSLLFLGLGISTFSCFDESLTILEPGQYHARFDGNASGAGEDTPTPVLLPLVWSGATLGSAITVSYTVEGMPLINEETGETIAIPAVEGVHYVINGTSGSSEIAAGEFDGEISISMIDNLEEDGPKFLVLTITGVSGGFSAPPPGFVGKIYELTILDDD